MWGLPGPGPDESHWVRSYCSSVQRDCLEVQAFDAKALWETIVCSSERPIAYVVKNDPAEQDLHGIIDDIGRAWVDRSQRRSQPTQYIWLRRSDADTCITLEAISTDLPLLRFDPRLAIDLPLIDVADVDTIFPILYLIVNHPSLLKGRDFIFQHVGGTKTIVFGVKTDAVAKAQRTKIDALGTLEVIVEVVVLDL